MMPQDTHVALTRLPLPVVAERCRQQSVLFAQRAAHDPRFCFEVFRRAIVQHDQRAWEALITQYTQNTPVVRHWVESHPLFASAHEDAGYFINAAFERLWAALTPARFERFDDLPAVLRYLKMCVNSAITDHLRGRRPEGVVIDENLPAAVPELQVEPSELWEIIDRQIADERERTALYCRYVLQMKPAEIVAEHPDLFGGVREVYATLQNVLKRLRRDAALQNYVAGTAKSGPRGRYYG